MVITLPYYFFVSWHKTFCKYNIQPICGSILCLGIMYMAYYERISKQYDIDFNFDLILMVDKA